MILSGFPLTGGALEGDSERLLTRWPTCHASEGIVKEAAVLDVRSGADWLAGEVSCIHQVKTQCLICWHLTSVRAWVIRQRCVCYSDGANTPHRCERMGHISKTDPWKRSGLRENITMTKYFQLRVQKPKQWRSVGQDWVSCSVLHHGAAKHLQHPDPADVLLLRITASFRECADVNLGS